MLDEENAIPIKGEYKLSEYYRITIKEDNGKVIDTFYITKNFLPLLNTRMNAHPLIQYCFVRDLTAQYKQDYLALENAYLIQIAEWELHWFSSLAEWIEYLLYEQTPH